MNDAKSNPWAEIKRLQAENANLHFLIEQANEAMAGLRAENEKLKAKLDDANNALFHTGQVYAESRNQLAATEEALAQVQRESAELRDRSEAARKVADATVEYIDFKGSVREHMQLSYVLFAAARYYKSLAEPSEVDDKPTLLVNHREKDPLLGFFPGFPPAFDVKRAEKGLAQEGGSQEIGRNQAETGQGSILGR